MPEGVIAGGWSYVTAAYLITTVVLALYVLSLWTRGRAATEGRASSGGGASTEAPSRAQPPRRPARPGPTRATDRGTGSPQSWSGSHDD